jgi:leucyl aminopeptidase
LILSNNIEPHNATGPFWGAITAALYLEDFTANHTNWLHVMAWNNRKLSGRPIGGETFALLCHSTLDAIIVARVTEVMR